MPYVAINEHRIPYDIDGTEVGWMTSGESADVVLQGFPTWATSTQKGKLNSETRDLVMFGWLNYAHGLFFFFPEQVEFAGFSFLFKTQVNGVISTMAVLGSDDSTNGLDGTWETATYVKPSYSNFEDNWRRAFVDVSFSKPIKCLKIGMYGGGISPIDIAAVHLFGQKASGQTPDDIVFTDAAGTPLTKLIDFGDVPEGTTSYQQIRVKNVSATKNANDINLQLNHSDFDFSYNAGGPWLSVIDIASLGPGSLSSVIYLRHHLNPPLLSLGPKAARIIASVGSWT